MARKLATYVHVHGEDDRSHVFGPDDEVPAWAVKAITNPGAWVEEPDGRDALGDPAPPGDYAWNPPTQVEIVTDPGSRVDPAGDPSETWTVAQLRAYADEHDIDLGDATKKADILAIIEGPREP